MSNPELQKALDDLRKPFHPSQVTWKPGAVKGDRALALAYADLRAYMNRLDDVCGADWTVSYEPWGESRLICRLTVMGVTRSSTGETTNESERSEIGGTVAEAQAFKRAAAMFGLGRYLYNLPTGWADFDPATKKFTDKAKTRLTGILVQHYRRATDDKGDMSDLFNGDDHSGGDNGDAPQNKAVDVVKADRGALMRQFNELGNALYGDKWGDVCRRNALRISKNATDDVADLSDEDLQKLVKGMTTLQANKAGA